MSEALHRKIFRVRVERRDGHHLKIADIVLLPHRELQIVLQMSLRFPMEYGMFDFQEVDSAPCSDFGDRLPSQRRPLTMGLGIFS